MVNVANAMDKDSLKRQGKVVQGGAKELGAGKASKKEEKMAMRKEKKMLAKMVRNKKTAAEFGNHVPFACKNTTEKLKKNCYKGRS
jgi:hypothetical protein